MNLQNVPEQLGGPWVTAADLRRTADRRACWRGGRRDTDWNNRPISQWRYRERSGSPLRRWLEMLPLHRMAPDPRQ
jgi:hypothetical protein